MLIVGVNGGIEKIDGDVWHIDGNILSIAKDGKTVATFIHWNYVCNSDNLKS